MKITNINPLLQLYEFSSIDEKYSYKPALRIEKSKKDRTEKSQKCENIFKNH